MLKVLHIQLRQDFTGTVIIKERTNKISRDAVASCVQQSHEAASISYRLLEPKNLLSRSSTAVIWQRLVFVVASFFVRGRRREDQ